MSSLMAKLPLDFKELELRVHKRFHEFSTEADSGASREQAMADFKAAWERPP